MEGFYKNFSSMNETIALSNATGINMQDGDKYLNSQAENE